MRWLLHVILIILLAACHKQSNTSRGQVSETTLVVLGNVQDAGSPQIACKKECCKDLFNHPDPSRKVVSLGLVDVDGDYTYLFDASPDMPSQLRHLNEVSGFESEVPDAIFLTHAHIGHYTGLMHLGKEAMSADSVEVFAMPRMHRFLKTNGPWSQLVKNDNISLIQMERLDHMVLSRGVSVQPVAVPHRDEYSETVGFIINGPNKRALYIPDIDKWQKWSNSIVSLIGNVDYAFIDATFYSGKEINYREISEIPHPFVIESMELFKDMSPEEKDKVHFIHMNHTNPLLDPSSKESKEVEEAGFHIARLGMTFEL